MVDVTTPPVPPARDDARAAKAEAKAAKARAKALRPWYRKKRYLLTLAIVAIIGISVAGSGGDDQAESAAADEKAADAPDTFSSNGENPPQDDVTVTGCAVDEIGWMEATVDVVNNSSKQSNYMIEVTFESPDQSQQFGTGVALINNLEPGQKKAEAISALTEAPGEFTCRVTDVNRMAA